MITDKGITTGTGALVPWNNIKSVTRRAYSVLIETVTGADHIIEAVDDTDVRTLKRAIVNMKEMSEVERAYYIALFRRGAK
jgi:hypothetical protein